MFKLGDLVVGQSPRPEVELEFDRLVPDTKIVQRGCLDGLTRDEISELAPKHNEQSLFTRLPSGEGVSLSKRAVTLLGSKQLDILEGSGVNIVVVLCTGEFSQWSDREALMPSRILQHFVQGLKPAGHLGILSPLEQQIPATRERWAAAGHHLSIFALSPNASTAEAEAIARKFAENPPDLLVFDCVSYTRSIKKVVCDSVRRPGVLAITAIARFAAELLE